MKVRWTPEAEQDRAEIWDFIAADSRRSAARMDQLLGAAAETLSEFPRRGRSAKAPGTRELIPHESYRLIYEIDGEVVWMLAVVHTARQWPPGD